MSAGLLEHDVEDYFKELSCPLNIGGGAVRIHTRSGFQPEILTESLQFVAGQSGVGFSYQLQRVEGFSIPDRKAASEETLLNERQIKSCVVRHENGAGDEFVEFSGYILEKRCIFHHLVGDVVHRCCS